MFEQLPLILEVGKKSGQAEVPISFLASYIAIDNPTQATLSFAPGQYTTQPINARTVAATKSMTGQIQATDFISVWWSSQSPIQSGGNQVTLMFSDSPITLQVSDNGIVIVQGNVTATVAGTVNVSVQNASIPVTGNVNATIQNASIPVTGTIDANIQNAEINTNVVNAATAPVYNQDTTGAYSTQEPFSVSGGGTSSGLTLISSSVGGFLQSLFISMNINGTYTPGLLVYNGSQLIAHLNFTTNNTNASFTFGNGVANNGVTVTGDGGADTWGLTGYGAISQNTPPAVPANLV